MKFSVRQIAIAAILVAVGLALSGFSIPYVGFPFQHLINVLAGILLGPGYAVMVAFCISMLRFVLGTGTLVAFPGSMIGALLCGLLWHYSGKIWAACIGEVIGTGVLGALCAYPVAAYLVGREMAFYGFIIPFCISSAFGAAIGLIFVSLLRRTHLFRYFSAHPVHQRKNS